MTVAIRYFTKSKKGNTKKLADAVSAATGLKAEEVSVDLAEKADRLFLINAMYAAQIDPEVKAFLERGKSTLPMVKKEADRLGIALSDREFHCAASWIFINKGLPTDEDFARAGDFAKSML